MKKTSRNEHIELWKYINEYVIACGGDPGAGVYGNVLRQKAVADIETLLEKLKNKDAET